jgi:hypothetical protein
MCYPGLTHYRFISRLRRINGAMRDVLNEQDGAIIPSAYAIS